MNLPQQHVGKQQRHDDRSGKSRDAEGRVSRVGLKEADASSQRRNRNISRRELSSRIRKERRSHTVQLKRRVNSNSNSNSNSSSSLGGATTGSVCPINDSIDMGTDPTA